MPYHAIAILPGDRQKTIPNREESKMLSDVVLPFVATGTVTASWGEQSKSYQVLELRIYQTTKTWDKKAGPLDKLIRGKRNQYVKFKKRAEKLLATDKPKVFIVMPIQGDKYGGQDQQRIYAEFNKRFSVIESTVSKSGCVAIRIDKEHHLGDLVARIKQEIHSSQFVIADLTDERPSCYFEAGYAEALGKPVIYVASKQSILHPGSNTTLHFDVDHNNFYFFSNHGELRGQLEAAINKNRPRLFGDGV